MLNRGEDPVHAAIPARKDCRPNRCRAGPVPAWEIAHRHVGAMTCRDKSALQRGAGARADLRVLAQGAGQLEAAP
jgi:hypothetical protein